MLMEIAETTGSLPKALESRPLPRSDCTKYRNVFQLLSGQRQYNEVGLQPILVSEIIKYCEGVGIDCYLERDRIVRYMCAMDGVFTEHARKKQEEARAKAERKT